MNIIQKLYKRKSKVFWKAGKFRLIMKWLYLLSKEHLILGDAMNQVSCSPDLLLRTAASDGYFYVHGLSYAGDHICDHGPLSPWRSCWYPWSVLLVEGYSDSHGLCCSRRLCWCLWSALPPETMLMFVASADPKTMSMYVWSVLSQKPCESLCSCWLSMVRKLLLKWYWWL